MSASVWHRSARSGWEASTVTRCTPDASMRGAKRVAVAARGEYHASAFRLPAMRQSQDAHHMSAAAVPGGVGANEESVPAFRTSLVTRRLRKGQRRIGICNMGKGGGFVIHCLPVRRVETLRWKKQVCFAHEALIRQAFVSPRHSYFPAQGFNPACSSPPTPAAEIPRERRGRATAPQPCPR